MIENNMLAYKGRVPWHGLGFAVAADADGETMLKVAGLDWPVQRRALAMRNASGEKTVMLTSELGDWRAIVRADNNRVFQIASDRYHPVQNREIVDFFREYCDAGHASMETIGGLRDGAVVWALAKLHGGSSANLSDVDQLTGYMLLATSHDGSLKTIGKPTQVRVVCHNTLTAAIGDKSPATFSMKHSRKFGPREKADAQRVMGMASQQVARTNEVAASLANVVIDERGRVEFITRLLGGETVLEQVVSNHAQTGAGVSILDSILESHEVAAAAQDQPMSKVGAAILEAMLTSPGSQLETAKDTLWGAVNGVTYYADHISRARSDGNRMFSAWFGQGEQLKVGAMQAAMEMAGVS
jgi:phage/plasmid-like protein (TIGR03299 family)